MKAFLKTTSMFCSKEKSIGLKEIQQNDKSAQVPYIQYGYSLADVFLIDFVLLFFSFYCIIPYYDMVHLILFYAVAFI